MNTNEIMSNKENVGQVGLDKSPQHVLIEDFRLAEKADFTVISVEGCLSSSSLFG